MASSTKVCFKCARFVAEDEVKCKKCGGDPIKYNCPKCEYSVLSPFFKENFGKDDLKVCPKCGYKG